ncbi:MAG: hypothetical protein ACLQPN_00335 [Bryobacteraceae bacterium]
MERHILTWSYWLGLASAVITLVLRFLNMLGLLLPTVIKQGQTLWYMSFFKGALLFLLIAVATAGYIWAHSQKSQ